MSAVSGPFCYLGNVLSTTKQPKERSTGELKNIPGIFRLRSHKLPTRATDAAFCLRVMLSRIRPSPLTCTVKGLPVDERKRQTVTKDRFTCRVIMEYALRPSPN